MTRYQLINGDCRAIMANMGDGTVDAIVTDPPYHLTSIVKRFGPGQAPQQYGTDGAFARAARGFQGMTWDGGDVAFDPALWAECLRVLRPGGHVLAFGGTRTYHRLAVAIEDAGFEIRDCLFWLYGQGFPKSHSLDNLRGKTICGCDGPPLPYAHGQEVPEHDLRLVPGGNVPSAVDAQNQRREVLQPGVPEQGSPCAMLRSQPGEGFEAGKESSLARRSNIEAPQGELQRRAVRSGAGLGETDGAHGRLYNGTPPSNGENVRVSLDPNGSGQPSRPQPGEQRAEQPRTVADERGPQAGGVWPLCPGCGKPIVAPGLGTALKPACEPIVMGRKPLEAGSVAANVLRHGTGAINIDDCRVETVDETARECNAGTGNRAEWRTGNEAGTHGGHVAGRFPANVLHDGSDAVVGIFPHTKSTPPGNIKPSPSTSDVYGQFAERSLVGHTDQGSAARFFYNAKASKRDRDEGCEALAAVRAGMENGSGRHLTRGDDPDYEVAKRANFHPTVKPTDVMRWLCRLVTPPGGVVFDPFTGSGSTGKAALLEGFRFIGAELTPDYIPIARARLEWAAKQPA